VSEGLRIAVAGEVAGRARQGGATWAVLQYAVGLRGLGHHVHVLQPEGELAPPARAYFREALDHFGLAGELIAPGGGVKGFDVVLNLSGVLEPAAISSIPTRVYVDLDPAFNQMWQESGVDRRFDGHTHFVTVGLAVGTEACDVPTLGRSWIPTLPPVVIDCWPPGEAIQTAAMTTVANFRSYGAIERGGVRYGQKVHSLRTLISLPKRVRARFVLAMAVDPAEERDIAQLRANGWELVDPVAVAGTPDAYQAFVAGSWAEIGISKSGYVDSRCGWFSDRSTCYLASGRPVVAQDTAFSRFLPVGRGLFAFDDLNGAAAAIEELQSDYARHSAAAREVALEHLDSRKVLTGLLERVAS